MKTHDKENQIQNKLFWLQETEHRTSINCIFSLMKGASMRTSTIAAFVLLSVFMSQGGKGEVIYRTIGTPGSPPWPQDSNCMYQCPPDHPTQAIGPVGPDGVIACDPAFITYDHAWAALKRVAVGGEKATVSPILSNASVDIEKALAKSLDEVKTPDRVWSVALEAWKARVSVDLQRQALARVRSLTMALSEGETLSFMLSALENPAAEMERCRELGRSTALERKKAADRLALLLQNPNLADRLR